jgi:hypothetical protein
MDVQTRVEARLETDEPKPTTSRTINYKITVPVSTDETLSGMSREQIRKIISEPVSTKVERSIMDISGEHSDLPESPKISGKINGKAHPMKLTFKGGDEFVGGKCVTEGFMILDSSNPMSFEEALFSVKSELVKKVTDCVCQGMERLADEGEI